MLRCRPTTQLLSSLVSTIRTFLLVRHLESVFSRLHEDWEAMRENQYERRRRWIDNELLDIEKTRIPMSKGFEVLRFICVDVCQSGYEFQSINTPSMPRVHRVYAIQFYVLLKKFFTRVKFLFRYPSLFSMSKELSVL